MPYLSCLPTLLVASFLTKFASFLLFTLLSLLLLSHMLELIRPFNLYFFAILFSIFFHFIGYLLFVGFKSFLILSSLKSSTLLFCIRVLSKSNSYLIALNHVSPGKSLKSIHVCIIMHYTFVEINETTWLF